MAGPPMIIIQRPENTGEGRKGPSQVRASGSTPATRWRTARRWHTTVLQHHTPAHRELAPRATRAGRDRVGICVVAVPLASMPVRHKSSLEGAPHSSAKRHPLHHSVGLFGIECHWPLSISLLGARRDERMPSDRRVSASGGGVKHNPNRAWNEGVQQQHGVRRRPSPARLVCRFWGRSGGW